VAGRVAVDAVGAGGGCGAGVCADAVEVVSIAARRNGRKLINSKFTRGRHGS
jgi:hypothetical protein